MAAAPILRGSIGMVAGGELSLGDGSTMFASTMVFQVGGTWTGTLTLQGTIDRSVYTSLLATPIDTTTGSATITSASTKVHRCDATGLADVKLVGTGGGTGTVTVYIQPVLG